MTIYFELTEETANSADYIDRGYECAAWSQEWKAQPGTYPVEVCQKPDFYNPSYFVKVAAISGLGHFPALFCGNPVSKKAYDGTKDAGKPGTISVKLSARDLLTDPRVAIDTEEEYEVILAAAIVEAEKEYEWTKTQLRRAEERGDRYTKIDKPMIPNFELRRVDEAGRVLDRLYSCLNSRAQRGYENTRIRKAA